MSVRSFSRVPYTDWRENIDGYELLQRYDLLSTGWDDLTYKEDDIPVLKKTTSSSLGNVFPGRTVVKVEAPGWNDPDIVRTHSAARSTVSSSSSHTSRRSYSGTR